MATLLALPGPSGGMDNGDDDPNKDRDRDRKKWEIEDVDVDENGQEESEEEDMETPEGGLNVNYDKLFLKAMKKGNTHKKMIDKLSEDG